MHKDFPLDPKIGTTSLIFHYVPFNVTIHIYTCRSIQYHGPKTIASKTMDRKTIGRFAQPNIGSKKKICRGVAPDPVEGGYPPPSNPPDRGGYHPPCDPPVVQSAQRRGGSTPPLTPWLTTSVSRGKNITQPNKYLKID